MKNHYTTDRKLASVQRRQRCMQPRRTEGLMYASTHPSNKPHGFLLTRGSSIGRPGSNTPATLTDEHASTDSTPMIIQVRSGVCSSAQVGWRADNRSQPNKEHPSIPAPRCRWSILVGVGGRGAPSTTRRSANVPGRVGSIADLGN